MGLFFLFFSFPCSSNYLPATGTLLRHKPPQQSASVRVDSGITQGDTISTFYDPMIAKLITHGTARVLLCGAHPFPLLCCLCAGAQSPPPYSTPTLPSLAPPNAPVLTIV